MHICISQTAGARKSARKGIIPCFGMIVVSSTEDLFSVFPQHLCSNVTAYKSVKSYRVIEFMCVMYSRTSLVRTLLMNSTWLGSTRI